jgi:hypothetical protein
MIHEYDVEQDIYEAKKDFNLSKTESDLSDKTLLNDTLQTYAIEEYEFFLSAL